MVDKKYTAKLELSRREEEVVRGFAENWLAWDELYKNDARERIYEELVKHKHEEYSMRGERATKDPMWNLVFPKNLCPSCNTDDELLKGTAAHTLEDDKENLLCRHCGFTIAKTLWEEGKKANEKEKEIKEKDKKFTEKIEKYKIPKEHLDELARQGIMEAQRAVRITTVEDEKKE